MIELRYLEREGEGEDIDEIVAHGASVHLEVLDDKSIMLIVEDAERWIHTTIFHKGRSPIRVRVHELDHLHSQIVGSNE